MTNRWLLLCGLSVICGLPRGAATEEIRIEQGDLTVLFRDNSRSPEVLSGVQSLFHASAGDFDAFDPDSPGASAGLNFEHIISGHRSPDNKFTPRHGRYALRRLPLKGSVVLVRRHTDSPWAVSSTLRYTVSAPHAIDFEFRCRAHEPERFGERGYAIFFFANYMNDVEDPSLHFPGVDGPDGEEKWIAADAPAGHPDWRSGGTYRHRDAPELEYDEDVEFRLNSWSYDFPRFISPFYYGRAANSKTARPPRVDGQPALARCPRNASAPSGTLRRWTRRRGETLPACSCPRSMPARRQRSQWDVARVCSPSRVEEVDGQLPSLDAGGTPARPALAVGRSAGVLAVAGGPFRRWSSSAPPGTFREVGLAVADAVYPSS